ncbi:lipoprotein insertase outer membrane protein LolB [Marinagarivorans algicola]|uniref:lipoprotein insertase outer membrane protein LolB n=1 Tax=Marinagarivorans algicola TaxID=1513270 RepID=UPI0006B42AC7|nr:lipoprotein insertase outer membrane protein LolB [Marinagarivorans algicola]
MRFLLLLLAISLAGCQSFNPQKNTSSSLQPIDPAVAILAQKHRKKLAKFNKWVAKGKIKISAQGDPNSASFEWQQFNNNYDINFFGPFGYGNSWLRRTSKGVTLEVPERPPQRARTAEQLLQQTVGWQAPISDLQYWIKGLPAPQGVVDKQHFTQHGALSQLQQQGWDLAFSRHQHYQDLWLPGKVVASRQGVTVLVIIKQWTQP